MNVCVRCDRHMVWGWAVGLAMLAAGCGPGKVGGATGGSGPTSGAESSGTSTSGAGASTDGATLTSAGETTGTTGTTAAEPTTGASTTGCSSQGCSPIDAGPGECNGAKECDPWVQDCPPGQKCMPTSCDGDNSWESLKCMPVMENPGQVGDPCTVEGGGVSGIDSCDVGHMCWDVDPVTLEGECVKFCTGSPDMPVCEVPKTTCTASEVLILCLPVCDPLIGDCSDAEVCIPNMGNFICVLDASGEEGQEYDVCEYANGCDMGLFCANPADDDSGKCDEQAIGCCLSFCDLTAPAPQCTSAQDDPNSLVECVPWFEDGMVPPWYESLGACVIPS